MRHWRLSPFGPILVAMMLLTSWTAMLASADSSSDTGSVTVEIVPPGTLLTTPEPGFPAGHPPAEHAAGKDSYSLSAHGTLSAAVMWLPNPAQGINSVHGLVAVQDHRAQASGWTVHLQGDGTTSAFLLKVQVGGAGFGLPEWLYAGIFTWDVSVGAPLLEAPQLVTAPPRTGYSLTIHQLWIEVDPVGLGAAGSLYTLVLMLPSAP